MSILLVQGTCLQIPLADQSVHCIVTSPVYWGLRSYSTGEYKGHELGSEPLHDCLSWARGEEPCGLCYICRMRQVARECWRVLRDDGVMFWNIADSMYSQTKGTGGPSDKQDSNAGSRYDPIKFDVPGLKPKDRCGIPERTALAFQADGWWWRSGITWVKPNPMPESVTDRPTKSTEMIYVFTKRERYFWDAEAVREPHTTNYGPDGRTVNGKELHSNPPGWSGNPKAVNALFVGTTLPANPAGRNLRDAWTIATQSYPGAHYATFPMELPRRCIKAATSERGCCPKCGKPWEMVTERGEKQSVDGYIRKPNTSHADGLIKQFEKWNRANPMASSMYYPTETTGWRAACACDAGDPVPCNVLDPFSGAATTILVARELGRNGIGLELSGEYLQQSRDRLSLTALDDWSAGKGNGKAADLSDLPMFRSEP